MITFVIPTRNNLPYLKLAHASIRKFYREVEILIMDDGSTDGTLEWVTTKNDPHTLYERSVGRQLGHTVLYDEGVKLCSNEIFTIFHADMVCGPNYVENLIKHLKPGSVIAATRIEPPLHPAGKEKIVKDFGIYDTDFKQKEFEQFVLKQQSEDKDKTTKGIFAPWAMYKKDFLEIGGHDKLFSPFPYEDSDIFQRFILARYDVKQSRDSFVYHFTCRGHRWTEQVQKDDLFYKLCCVKNASHFIRKWGHWIQNDDSCYPVIHKKFDIGVTIKNCNEQLLPHLEPWFSTIYVPSSIIDKYVSSIQAGTPFDIKKRVKSISNVTKHDINIQFDGSQLNSERLKTLIDLPKMIEDSGEVGDMEYDIFNLSIRKLEDKTPLLVQNDSSYYVDQLVTISQRDPYHTDELFKVFEEVKKKE